MKKRIAALALLLLVLLAVLSGCKKKEAVPSGSLASLSEAETLASIPDSGDSGTSGRETSELPDSQTLPEESAFLSSVPETSDSSGEEISSETPEPAQLPAEPESSRIDENGEYTSPEEVALYINTFHKLPSNFITKSEAQALGWDSSRGNLQKVAPGKSIGGDRFGNYEGLLPSGKYYECDVNYHGGYRGSERLIYKKDGTVYYTKDHYESFEQLY